MYKSVQIIIRGAVQGVGFRPFVYKLATKMNLKGYVLNSPLGVIIVIDGYQKDLEEFILRIKKEKPPISKITGMEFSFLDPKGFTHFEIKNSETNRTKSTLIVPDIAVCEDCLKEMMDPNDRRYLYPFINCTNCGPRFSIIESLPYDRPNTSMKIFEMCDDCKKEYLDPLNRRFHAQPIACPNCGPHLELWDNKGNMISSRQSAVKLAAKLLSENNIIALKGLGGFQLIADARNDDAVNLLRIRKHRQEKPFAVMMFSVSEIGKICEISLLEKRLLTSPEAPIVLLRKKSNLDKNQIASSIAPDNPYLGIMLPYTPLHFLLLKETNFPVIATSGNISEEPMCIDESEALLRLGDIADYFLVHNRPIVRHVDDSIVRVIRKQETVLRRARGYAPFPVLLNPLNFNGGIHKNVIAAGGELKNTVSLKVENYAFISQHIGDLSNKKAYESFIQVINDFKNLYDIKSADMVCDLHPEYLSTKYFKSKFGNVKFVQHHYAHIASCRAENQVTGTTLGVAWDGTGYGTDGTVWGGELFISDNEQYFHVGQFKQFMLPGSETAIKEPRRSAAGVLFEIFGEQFIEKFPSIRNYFSNNELNVIITMLTKKFNSPFTSSVGRLFDAVASLLNISQYTSFEGQSAMKVEFAVIDGIDDAYNFDLLFKDIIIINWQPMIIQILNDIAMEISAGEIITKFHNTLADIILSIAKLFNITKVILSGGCFQNLYLTQKTSELLEKNNFNVYTHQRIPPNDGGISLGQIAAMDSELKVFDFSQILDNAKIKL